MNIAVITSPFGALPPHALGAVEKLFHQLAETWASMGHSVTFLCAGGGDNPAISYVRLRRSNRSGKTILDLIPDFFYSLLALIRSPKCDILFCNTFWSPFLAPLFRWKYKRLVYGVHRYPKHQFFLYPGVHLFICVSRIVESILLRRFHYHAKVLTINNPCSIPRNEPPSGEFADVIYAGRIHPEKGLDLLCKALELIATKSTSPLSLKLIGPWMISEGGGGDAYLNRLKASTPHVRFILTGGLKDPHNFSAELKSGKLFCYPSIAERGETFGVAPLEAMALGLPIVLSRLQCFTDFAIEGKNAMFFDHRAPDRVQQCAHVLACLLEDAQLRNKMSTNGIETATRFSVQYIAMLYINAFKEALTNEP